MQLVRGWVKFLTCCRWWGAREKRESFPHPCHQMACERDVTCSPILRPSRPFTWVPANMVSSIVQPRRGIGSCPESSASEEEEQFSPVLLSTALSFKTLVVSGVTSKETTAASEPDHGSHRSSGPDITMALGGNEAPYSGHPHLFLLFRYASVQRTWTILSLSLSHITQYICLEPQGNWWARIFFSEPGVKCPSLVWDSLSCLKCHVLGQEHAFSSQRDHKSANCIETAPSRCGGVAGVPLQAWAWKPILSSTGPSWHVVGESSCKPQ